MQFSTTLKSISAVVAGFLTVAVLSVLMDKILEGLGILPPASEAGLFVPWMLIVVFLYRSLFAILGGYVTARLAPEKPMRLVTILGILGTIGGIMGVIVGWNLSQHWYPIALAVTAFPLVWFGGTLRMKKNR